MFYIKSTSRYFMGRWWITDKRYRPALRWSVPAYVSRQAGRPQIRVGMRGRTVIHSSK